MLKVMLAATWEKGTQLRFPLMASPKLDGIRCSIQGGLALSRSLKMIPNLAIQRMLGKREFEHLDGELIIGEANAPDVYRKTVSGVMSEHGIPDVSFHVFDWVGPGVPFKERFGELNSLCFPGIIQIVQQAWITNQEDLDDYEQMILSQGYEGVMLRSPQGPYKHGRSTLKEGSLLKLKRFSDSEAKIIGFEERMHNSNAQERDERGYAKRSSAQEGMVPMNTLGALLVQDIKTCVEFSIGTGFNDEQRSQIWANRSQILGKVAKYKYFEIGDYDKPRFPVFLGFRMKEDML